MLLALMVMVSLPAPALRTSNIRIQDIEKIDITGSGDNDLTLNLNDVLEQLVLFLFYKTTPTSC
jgi:hypothetical protein